MICAMDQNKNNAIGCLFSVNNNEFNDCAYDKRTKTKLEVLI